MPIIFDSGCTHTVTPFRDDFVGKVKSVRKLMKGLGAAAEVIGCAPVRSGSSWRRGRSVAHPAGSRVPRSPPGERIRHFGFGQ